VGKILRGQSARRSVELLEGGALGRYWDLALKGTCHWNLRNPDPVLAKWKCSKTIPSIRHYGNLGTLKVFKTKRKITYPILKCCNLGGGGRYIFTQAIQNIATISFRGDEW